MARRWLACHKGCPGWPETMRSTWAGPVVTCRCGARRYRPERVSKTLWRRVTRYARATRLWERLRPHLLDLFLALATFAVLFGSLAWVVYRYVTVWR
jgi:hypothetical protein